MEGHQLDRLRNMADPAVLAADTTPTSRGIVFALKRAQSRLLWVAEFPG